MNGKCRYGTERAAQAHNAAQPPYADLAKILADRIAALGIDDGVTNIDACLIPLTKWEAAVLGVEAETLIPPSLVRKAMRCLEAPIETLIARQIVLSSEGIARLVPNLTAQVRASAIVQPELRRVL